jgi:surface polysaccharide O-acyltransferase-like enzyme
VLVLFSYLYFAAGVLQAHGSAADVLNILGFVKAIWQGPMTDSFWYLYFYLGLLWMLPWLQRLAKVMQKRDLLYMVLFSFGFGALIPLLSHYVPAFTPSGYVFIPLFSTYLGVFFAGHYIHAYAGKINRALCLIVIGLSLAAAAMLTYGEYQTLSGVGRYWFMDERTAPPIFVITCAAAVMMLAKDMLRTPDKQGKSRLQTLGGCAFGIYLVQDFLISQTRYQLFVPLAHQINPMLAALLWEFGVFLVSLMIVLLIRKIPGVKKFI